MADQIYKSIVLNLRQRTTLAYLLIALGCMIVATLTYRLAAGFVPLDGPSAREIGWAIPLTQDDLTEFPIRRNNIVFSDIKTGYPFWSHRKLSAEADLPIADNATMKAYVQLATKDQEYQQFRQLVGSVNHQIETQRQIVSALNWLYRMWWVVVVFILIAETAVIIVMTSTRQRLCRISELCPVCFYNMQGINVAVCPECGCGASCSVLREES